MPVLRWWYYIKLHQNSNVVHASNKLVSPVASGDGVQASTHFFGIVAKSRQCQTHGIPQQVVYKHCMTLKRFGERAQVTGAIRNGDRVRVPEHSQQHWLLVSASGAGERFSQRKNKLRCEGWTSAFLGGDVPVERDDSGMPYLRRSWLGIAVADERQEAVVADLDGVDVEHTLRARDEPEVDRMRDRPHLPAARDLRGGAA
eukprot:6173315-Pleurochrysis_carterae.AAC.4